MEKDFPRGKRKRVVENRVSSDRILATVKKKRGQGEFLFPEVIRYAARMQLP